MVRLSDYQMVGMVAGIEKMVDIEQVDGHVG
jgi:hypothetical protein